MHSFTEADPYFLYDEIQQRIPGTKPGTKKFETKKTFKGIFFSTSKMKESFRSYPKILFIDGTYKLVRNGFVFLIINVVDGNNYTHMIGAALLADEKAETLEAVMACLIAGNPEACQKVECIITDKDLTERAVLRKIFPNAQLFLCKFHTLRSFKREITPSNMETKPEIVQKVLEILNVMVHTKEESRFDEYYNKFCEIAPPKAREYYDKNWHPIKEEWATCFMLILTKGNFTNNRTESMNSHIKKFIPLGCTLCDFFEDFFLWLNSRNDEQRLKMSKRLIKRFRDNIYSKESTEFKYKELLSDHGFKKILEELPSRNPLTISKATNEGTFEGICGGKAIMVTAQECDCYFYVTYRLPCRHVFNVREQLGLDLYAEEICNPEYIHLNDLGRQPLLSNLNLPRDDLDVVSSPVTPKGTKPKKSCKIQSTPRDTYNNRYREMEPHTRDLCNMASQDNPLAEQLRASILELKRLSRLGVAARVLPVEDLECQNISENNTSNNEISDIFNNISKLSLEEAKAEEHDSSLSEMSF